jgi:hypothetical protein
MRVLICKEFTGLLSIVVGEEVNIPGHFVKLDNLMLLKDSYHDYCIKLQNEKRP